MTHRNEPRWHPNRGRPLAPGRAWKKPTYWPCDVRCTGGVNLFRAFVRNLRTWLAMAREKAQADGPRGRKCNGSRSSPPRFSHYFLASFAVWLWASAVSRRDQAAGEFGAPFGRSSRLNAQGLRSETSP